MKTKWYCADYDVVKDGKIIDQSDEYFREMTDEEAIEAAKAWAEDGVDYADIGHCELDLVQVVEVDDTEECFPEKRIVWY